MGSEEHTAKHELYYFSTCPYCMLVRLYIWWSGINIPLKDVISNPENSTHLITGGGKRQVPCLRIEKENGDVRWMYESMDIIRYLKAGVAL